MVTKPPRLIRVSGDGLFLIVGIVLVVSMVVAMSRHYWTYSADIWEHAAVVRSLAGSPLDPPHPELDVNAPHQFFSPYAVGLGIAATLTDTSPFTVLAVAGIGNLVFLLTSLRALVAQFTRNRSAALYVLLAMLLLWGPAPWTFSGFVHLDVLWQVLPYPATFAKAIALLALAVFIGHLRCPQRWRLGVVLVLGLVLLLTHPAHCVFLYLGMVTAAMGLDGVFRPRRLLTVIALGMGTITLGLAWPYYPLARFILEESAYRREIGERELVLFQDVVSRAYPTLLAAPVMVLRLRRSCTDPIAIMFLLLGVGYLTGWSLGVHFVGRFIVFITFLLQLAVGIELAEATVRGRTLALIGTVAFAGMAVLGAIHLRSGLWPVLPESHAASVLRMERPPGLTPVAYLRGVVRPIGAHDVVLATTRDGFQVPAFTGRTVASDNPLAFVPDHPQRIDAVKRFFDPGTPAEVREAILDRYCVSFLLVDSTAPVVSMLVPLGETRYADGRFTLIQLEKGESRCRRASPLAHR